MAAYYFLAQGLAGSVWWWVLFLSPAAYRCFAGSVAPGLLEGFLLPDLVLFVGGSLAVSLALFLRAPLAFPFACGLSGACLYATLFTLQAGLQGRLPLLGTVLMFPATLLTLHMTATGASPGGFPFRVARVATPARAMRLALLQTLVFYNFFFGAMPWLILRTQAECGWPRFAVPLAVRGLAALGFVLGGCLAIRSTALFAWRGQGTPLPVQAPAKLVVDGTYAWVRNPMAVGGIFQGLMVGLWLGSVPVMLYSLSGALIWHLFVRPVEEADLLNRFGGDYECYRRKVRCWWPRRKPRTHKA